MIQVYTGEGKGKTTAALGLAIRAAGAGLRVYIGQFIKGREYSEIKILRRLKNIKLEQFGRGCFIRNRPAKEDFDLAKRGLMRAKKIIADRDYRVVILDEINVALRLGLLKLKEILELIKDTPKDIELILTGRYAPKEIIKLADLVSQMKQIKHYYKKGTKARKGIEI
jgi:cob(I)alamin adenosyltransferase